MRKLVVSFVTLSLSRVFGLLREALIAIAFGYSRITDLFYQVTWPLIALSSMANGPFTTAFAARLAAQSQGKKWGHVRHHARQAVRLGVGFAGLFALAAGGLALWPDAPPGLAIAVLVLAPAAFGVTATGFVYAVATAMGWIATAAFVMLLSNMAFVAGTIVLWLAGAELLPWKLPGLYTLAVLAGLPATFVVLLKVRRALGTETNNETGDDTEVSQPLPGLGETFLVAGIETSAFLVTQATIVVLATLEGAGWVSAAALMQRVVFSVLGLIISPFSSLLMLRVLKQGDGALRIFRQALWRAGGGLAVLAVLLCLLLPPVATILAGEEFEHAASLSMALLLLPAFGLWLVPIGLNFVVCRTMFGLEMHRRFAITTVAGYVFANLLRLAVFPFAGLAWAIASGAVVEMAAALLLARVTLSRLEIRQMAEPADLVVFTMAGHSGMGRFASEMAKAAGQCWDGSVTLIAPPMEHEPPGIRRQILNGPKRRAWRPARILSLLGMDIGGTVRTWKSCRASTVFVMIDLYSTLPFSLLPLLAARLRGAVCVLNLHDFYPHASRYPRALASLEQGIYRFAYRRFDLIAATKPTQVTRLVNEAGVSDREIMVIEHGPFFLTGISPPETNEPPRILIFGSLRENKCVFESISAFRELRHAHVDLQLRIAGAPRLQELNYWERCRTALDGIDGVEINARYISDEELPKILSGVDAVICAYEGFDSQSGVSVMAVSNGVPLVSSQVAKVAGCEPLVEIPSPITSQAIAEAIDAMLAIPRPVRLAQGRAMQARLGERSLWSKAIETINNASLTKGKAAATRHDEQRPK